MSTIINARSPYYIKSISNPSDQGANENLFKVIYSIFIYSGHVTNDKPTTATYTVTKFVKETTDNFVVIEISELIRDYLETEYYTEAVDAVWVFISAVREDDTGATLNAPGGGTTDDQTYLAFDGYGEFEEGINPRTSNDPTNSAGFTPMVLQTNTCIPFVRGRDIKIPIFSEPLPQAQTTVTDAVWNFTDEFWDVEDSNWNDSDNSLPTPTTDANESGDKIYYLQITTDNAVTGDTITITSTSGNSQSVTLTLNEVCHPKYEAYRAIYYNKFGALQSFWLPTKHTIKTNTKSKDYKSVTIEATKTTGPSYSLYKHSNKRFQVTAQQSITLNTELLNECLNPAIEQLLTSEQVWLEDSSLTVRPVILRSQNLTRKTGVNNKANIQYELNFDFAFDHIQNIR